MTKAPDDHLIGKTIASVRHLRREEMERENWTHARKSETIVLVLDDGTTIFPSQDEEGNGPGVLFGSTPKNAQQFMVGIR